MKSNNKSLLLAILIAILMIFAFTLVGDQLYKTKEISYSEFISHVKKGDVAELKVEGQQLTGKLKGNKSFSTIGPMESDHLVELLDDNNVPHSFVHHTEGSFIQTIFPMLVFGMSLFLVFLIFRQMQGASGRAPVPRRPGHPDLRRGDLFRCFLGKSFRWKQPGGVCARADRQGGP